jgi:hypothetical protein
MATLAIRTQSGLRRAAMAVSVVWIGLTFYQEFVDVNPDKYGFRSPEVEAQMHTCSGTFQQRYECKEAAILAKGRSSFIVWMEKVVVILGPPLLLVGLFGVAARRQSRAQPALHRAEPIRRRRTR